MHAQVRKLASTLGVVLLAGAVAPASSVAAQTAPAPAAASAGFDGNPATTERLNEGHPTFAAVDISRLRFRPSGTGGRQPRHVVLSRDDTFADSVAGSGLSTDGPLLLTARDRLSVPTAAEISRVLPAGGRVFLLGGVAALSDAVAGQVRSAGYEPVRLAGATRVETAVAVADAVRALRPGEEVLLARAFGPGGNDTAAWADSLAGGAVAAKRGIPILVTPTDSLHPAVATWLARDTTSRTTLLGGPAALSAAVEARVPSPQRVAGADRAATAVAVATSVWGVSTTGPRRFVVANAVDDTGWAFGFAAAGLAGDADAPVLLVTTEVADATLAMTRTCGTPQVDLVVIGDGTVMPAAFREQLDAADGLACGERGAVVYPSDLAQLPECAAVLDHFRRAALERIGPYGPLWENAVGSPRREAMAPAQGTTGTGAPSLPTTDSGSSGTNVQEVGVDEPDVVKTDGRHLFTVNGSRLRVVRVDGPKPLLVATLNLSEDGSHELLLSGTRLLVVSRRFSVVPLATDGRPAAASILPMGPARTTLTYVDVVDPSAPVVRNTLELEGDYRSARMVGTVARVVLQTDPDLRNLVGPQAATPEAEREAAAHNRAVLAATTLDDWLPAFALRSAGGQELESAPLLSCRDIRTPPFFSGLGTLSVVSIDVAQSVRPTSSAAVVASGDSMYASTDRVFVTTGRSDWEPEALDGGITTEVHGFDISQPSATRYVGSGSVPGYILNSFALSHHGGHLRVATTSQPPWRADNTPVRSDSGIHVLAEQTGRLVEVGRVRGLGLGERIFGVRYFGDLAAVVTFRQIDPLYLVDLSTPTAPRVTGELKLPGYSAYLHRVGEGRILGVGSDATTDGRVIGAQVSLFDISNTAAPRLVRSVKYPDASALVEFDHHAFLHWPATGLTVVPMQTHTRTGPGFLGAVGLAVAPDAVREVGRLSHTDDATSPNAYPQITRSVVANGALFTVSDAGVEMADLTTLQERGFVAFG